MMIRKMLFVLPLAAMMILAGCGDGIPDDQSTPKAALKKFIYATKAGNGEKLFEVMDATEQQKPLVEAMAKFGSEAMELAEAAEKKFGDKWSGDEVAGTDFSQIEKQLDQVEVKEEGDKATLTMPGQVELMRMVKKDGKWLVTDLDQLPTDPKEIEQAAKMMDAMAKVLKDVRPKLDEKGMTIRKFAEELRKEMTAAQASNIGR